MRNKTVCFTGHRKLPQMQEIASKLKTAIIALINNGYCYFCCGGALGFDTLAAQAVLDLKEFFPHIKLVLVLPCKNQTRGWQSTDVKLYEQILNLADKCTYTAENYHNGCMHKRNRHLVDSSSICVCYLAENKGGTAYTVKYAKKQGLKIMNIYDKSCTEV